MLGGLLALPFVPALLFQEKKPKFRILTPSITAIVEGDYPGFMIRRFDIIRKDLWMGQHIPIKDKIIAELKLPLFMHQRKNFGSRKPVVVTSMFLRYEVWGKEEFHMLMKGTHIVLTPKQKLCVVVDHSNPKKPIINTMFAEEDKGRGYRQFTIYQEDSPYFVYTSKNSEE